jgi:hypothetical protein
VWQAAYQIEGAAAEDGRGQPINTFSHTPGVSNGHTAMSPATTATAGAKIST